MSPWLAPFLYLLITAAVFFFTPAPIRPRVQQQGKANINFYLVCAIVVVFASIVGTLNWKVTWMDYAAWFLAVVLGGVSAVKLLKDQPLPDENHKSH